MEVKIDADELCELRKRAAGKCGDVRLYSPTEATAELKKAIEEKNGEITAKCVVICDLNNEVSALKAEVKKYKDRCDKVGGWFDELLESIAKQGRTWIPYKNYFGDGK